MAENKLTASLTLVDGFSKKMKKIADSMQDAASSMDDFKSQVSGNDAGFKQMAEEAIKQMERMNSSIETGFSNIEKSINSVIETILLKFGNLGNQVSDELSGVALDIDTTSLGEAQEQVTTLGGTIVSELESAELDVDFTSVLEAHEEVTDLGNSLNSDLETALGVNYNAVTDAHEQVMGLGDVLNGLGNAHTKVSADVRDLTDAGVQIKQVSDRLAGLNRSRLYLRTDGSEIGRLSTTLNRVQQEQDKISKTRTRIRFVVDNISGTFNSIRSQAAGVASRIGNSFRRAGSELATSFSGVNNSLRGISGNAGQAFSSISSGAKGAGASVRDLVAAFGLLKVAEVGIGQLRNNMGAGIARYDRLQQFPRVMEMWGYSMEQVEASRTKMVEGIDGLPTTLQDIMGNIQTFTSVTGDLDKATDIGIALNNAFLASGSSADDASRGMRAFTNSLATGRIDAMTFETMITTMPKALEDVAREFGHTGDTWMGDFREDLTDGTISIGEFTDALIAMNDVEGGLAEQARAAIEGIGTAFTNLRNRMTIGIASFLGAIDNWLVERGFGTIASNLIEAIGAVDKAFDYMNTNLPIFLDNLYPYLEVIMDGFNEIKEPVVDAITAIWESLTELLGFDFGGESSVASFRRFIQTVVGGIKDLAAFAEEHSDTIAQVIKIFGQLVTAFLAFNIGRLVLGAPFRFLRVLFNPIFGFITMGWGIVRSLTGLGAGLMGAFGRIFGFGGRRGGALGGVPFGASLSRTASTFLRGAASLAVIWGAIQLIGELAGAIQRVSDSVPDDYSTLTQKLAVMAYALGGMSAFVIGMSFLFNNRRMMIGGAAGLGMLAGISGNIILASEALRHMDEKVSDDIGNIATKFVSMAVAIAGMGLLVAAAGGLTMMGIPVAIAGLAMITLLNLELILAAEVMKQFDDKVPGDFGSFAQKILIMSTAIISMGVLVAAAGLFAMLNPVGAIAGLVMVTALALELRTVAESIKQLDEKVPDDLDKVNSKLEAITNVIKAFNESGLGSLVELFNNIFSTINISVVSSGVEKMVEMSEDLKKIEDVDLDLAKATTNVDALKDILKLLSEGNLGELIGAMIDRATLSTASDSIDALAETIEPIQEIADLDIDLEEVKQTVADLKAVLDQLSKSIFADLFSQMISTDTIGSAQSALEAFNDMLEPLGQLKDSGLDAESTLAKIEEVKSVLDALRTGIFNNWFSKGIDIETVSHAEEILNAFVSVVEIANQIQDLEVDKDATIENIDSIKAVLDALQTGVFSNPFTQSMDAESLMENIVLLQSIAGLVYPIETIASMDVDKEQAISNIQAVKEVLNELEALPEVGSTEGLDGLITTFNNLQSTITAMSMQSQMDVSAMVPTFQTAFTAIQVSAQNAMTVLNVTITSGMAVAQATVAGAAPRLVYPFQALYSPMYAAGNQAMAGLRSGIVAGASSAISAAQAVANRISRTVQSAWRIHSPSRVFRDMAGQVIQGLVVGFKNGTRTAVDGMQKLISSINDASIGISLPSLAIAASIPSMPDLAYSGNVGISVNEDDLSYLRAQVSTPVVVNTRQVTPNITVNVEGGENGEVDVDEIVRKVEQVVLEAAEGDLT